jgi:undecaprenyl pyrophosphate phosphatase UppP
VHPISYLQAIVLGLIQGIAEPFPISSLGHAVIVPKAAFTTYIAVKFLLRFFQTNRLTPFGVYCIVAGIYFTVAFAL